jgi:hypothetical protein
MEKINLKKKTVMIVDSGIFVSFALKFASYFGKAYYFTPWNVGGFPKKDAELPGTGMDEMESVDYFWDYVDKADLFIFLDVYFSDIQMQLVRMGKRVFGARDGEMLELNRWDAKQIFRKSNIPVNGVRKIKGLKNLREYLKNNENKFIKIDHWRGAFETFGHKKYILTEPTLDQLQHLFGVMKFDTDFVVEDAIDSIAEVGIDSINIEGEFPNKVIVGIEEKGCSYIGKVFDYDKLPNNFKNINSKLRWYFKEKQYRGLYSDERRITRSNVMYLIDPACRVGRPPGEVEQEMINNWGDIAWFGAEGIQIEPEYTCKYGAESIVHSNWVTENWQTIYFPNKASKNIKLSNFCVRNGVYNVIPQPSKSSNIGAIIGLGDTMDEAISEVDKYSKMIEGKDIEIEIDSLEKNKESCEKARTIGFDY